MISVVTRVKHPELYDRLKDSVRKNSVTEIKLAAIHDLNGDPDIARTYNSLGSAHPADIIVFAEDDVMILDDAWDIKLMEEFEATGADILGVVGVDEYKGSPMFGVGYPHCFGKYVTGDGDEPDTVKIFSRRILNKRLDVIDGFFMAVRGEFFKKNKFDEQFDGLWCYPEDLCLRGKVYLSDILLAHHKPSKYYGKYPENLRPESDYSPAFYKKWGIEPMKKIGDMRCATTKLPNLISDGQDRIYAEFESRYIHA